MDIPTNPTYPKEEQNYPSQFLLTYFREEFLKILKNLLARPSIFSTRDYDQQDGRVKNNFLFFMESVKQ